MYDTFVDLLIDITQNTSVNIGKLKKLIELDFFEEFGKAKKLYIIAELYELWKSKKTAKFYNKAKREEVQLPFKESLIEKYSEKKTECQIFWSGFLYQL